MDTGTHVFPDFADGRADFGAAPAARQTPAGLLHGAGAISPHLSYGPPRPVNAPADCAHVLAKTPLIRRCTFRWRCARSHVVQSPFRSNGAPCALTTTCLLVRQARQLSSARRSAVAGQRRRRAPRGLGAAAHHGDRERAADAWGQHRAHPCTPLHRAHSHAPAPSVPARGTNLCRARSPRSACTCWALLSLGACPTSRPVRRPWSPHSSSVVVAAAALSRLGEEAPRMGDGIMGWGNSALAVTKLTAVSMPEHGAPTGKQGERLPTSSRGCQHRIPAQGRLRGAEQVPSSPHGQWHMCSWGAWQYISCALCAFGGAVPGLGQVCGAWPCLLWEGDGGWPAARRGGRRADPAAQAGCGCAGAVGHHSGRGAGHQHRTGA